MPVQRYGPGAGTPPPTPSTPELSPAAAGGLGALVLVLLVLAVWGCVSVLAGDRPPEPTPAEVRDERRAVEDERRAVEDMKAYCGLWWDGLMELTDEQAQLCVDTGWGK